MFTLVAVLLTVLGIVSKNDVREAIRDMKSDLHESTVDAQQKFEKETGQIESKMRESEAKVDKGIEGMEKKFEALSGTALKRPKLDISLRTGLLDGQQFNIRGLTDLPIYPMFIKNTGDKTTEPLSVRLHFSADPNVDQKWELAKSG